MHRAQLEQYINNPALLDEKSIEGLWQLVKEYPYFATARLLLAKNLEMTGHEAYPLAFRLAAAYAGDRSLLKQLMEPVQYPAPIEVEEQFVSPAEIIIPETEIEVVVGNEPLNTNEEVKKTEEIISELNSNVTIGEELELQSEESKSASPGIDLIEDKFGKEVIIIKEEAKEEKVYSPMIDLIRQSLQKARDNERGAEVIEPSISAASDKVKTSKRQALIDKFIKDEPRISAPKKEFFNPEDHARQSSVVHEDLVSETLAIVYVKQGLIGKAIKIYEKLILLIPEKSSYFAGRIEELRKEHK